jgi:D-alanine-D-alanine ligase
MTGMARALLQSLGVLPSLVTWGKLMKFTILTYVEHEGSKGHDVVVDQVAEALAHVGHKASILSIHGDLKKLLAGLSRRKPDLVFNLMETFGETQLGAVGVVGLLDLLGVRYTGDGPGEFYLIEDKVLTKKLLAYEGIRCPDFAVFSQGSDLETGGNLHLPLFVKPLRMDGSIGIDASKSLVRGVKEMMEQVLEIHEKVKDAALVEEYIEGREFYVGVLGNNNPTAFPPIEMDFSGLPAGAPRVLDARAKWDENSPEYRGTQAKVAEVPDDLRARLQKVATDAYRALRVRDYGRIDLRLTEAGDIYVIEVNASCYLEQSSEFAMAATAAGLEYPELIKQIVEQALGRYDSLQPKVSKRKRRTASRKT